MKRVYMTKFGDGNGDCLTACIASLIEVDSETLPDFSSFGKPWHQKTVPILRSYGYESIYVFADTLKTLPNPPIVSDCLCICIFDTGTHEDHVKIGRWTSTYDAETNTWAYSVDEVFDPHPNPTFECVALRGMFLIFPAIDGKRHLPEAQWESNSISNLRDGHHSNVPDVARVTR